MRRDEVSGIGAGSILRRKADGSYECTSDEVAVEEPLEIRIANKPVVVTMRTPGHDDELAAGLLLAEGIIRDRSDLEKVGHCLLPESKGNVLQVSLRSDVRFERTPSRFGTISTSCGLCGKTSIADIRRQFPPLRRMKTSCLDIEQLLQMPAELRRGQGNFARTGGIHAAAVFDLRGNLTILREDVGRHNAVDKVLGRALLDGNLPLSDYVLLVSGRTSLEIVQKALAAGISVVASVSAPSTLAVNFAREAGQTLIGFLRPPSFNVYAHIERLNSAFAADTPGPRPRE